MAASIRTTLTAETATIPEEYKQLLQLFAEQKDSTEFDTFDDTNFKFNIEHGRYFQAAQDLASFFKKKGDEAKYGFWLEKAIIFGKSERQNLNKSYSNLIMHYRSLTPPDIDKMLATFGAYSEWAPPPISFDSKYLADTLAMTSNAGQKEKIFMTWVDLRQTGPISASELELFCAKLQDHLSTLSHPLRSKIDNFFSATAGKVDALKGSLEIYSNILKHLEALNYRPLGLTSIEEERDRLLRQKEEKALEQKEQEIVALIKNNQVKHISELPLELMEQAQSIIRNSEAKIDRSFTDKKTLIAYMYQCYAKSFESSITYPIVSTGTAHWGARAFPSHGVRPTVNPAETFKYYNQMWHCIRAFYTCSEKSPLKLNFNYSYTRGWVNDTPDSYGGRLTEAVKDPTPSRYKGEYGHGYHYRHKIEKSYQFLVNFKDLFSNNDDGSVMREISKYTKEIATNVLSAGDSKNDNEIPRLIFNNSDTFRAIDIYHYSWSIATVNFRFARVEKEQSKKIMQITAAMQCFLDSVIYFKQTKLDRSDCSALSEEFLNFYSTYRETINNDPYLYSHYYLTKLFLGKTPENTFSREVFNDLQEAFKFSLACSATKPEYHTRFTNYYFTELERANNIPYFEEALQAGFIKAGIPLITKLSKNITEKRDYAIKSLDTALAATTPISCLSELYDAIVSLYEENIDYGSSYFHKFSHLVAKQALLGHRSHAEKIVEKLSKITPGSDSTFYESTLSYLAESKSDKILRDNIKKGDIFSVVYLARTTASSTEKIELYALLLLAMKGDKPQDQFRQIGFDSSQLINEANTHLFPVTRNFLGSKEKNIASWAIRRNSSVINKDDDPYLGDLAHWGFPNLVSSHTSLESKTDATVQVVAVPVTPPPASNPDAKAEPVLHSVATIVPIVAPQPVPIVQPLNADTDQPGAIPAVSVAQRQEISKPVPAAQDNNELQPGAPDAKAEPIQPNRSGLFSTPEVAEYKSSPLRNLILGILVGAVAGGVAIGAGMSIGAGLILAGAVALLTFIVKLAYDAWKIHSYKKHSMFSHKEPGAGAEDRNDKSIAPTPPGAP